MKTSMLSQRVLLTFVLVLLSQLPLTGQNADVLPLLNQSYLGSTFNIFGNYPTNLDFSGALYSGNHILPVIYDQAGYTDGSKWTEDTKGNAVIYSWPKDLVNATWINQAQTDTYYGSSTCEFQSDLALSATASGYYGSFSGSVSADYAKSVESSESQYVGMILVTYSGYYATIDKATYTNLDNFDPTFVEDLKSQDPVAFFKKYGTHLVTGLYMGQALEYQVYGSQSDFTSQESFSASAEAQYNNLTQGAGATFDLSTSTTINTSAIQSSESITPMGGKNPGSLDPENTDSFNDWINSFWDQESYQVCTGVYPDGLIPLWNLLSTTDPDRANELEQAFLSNFTPHRDPAVKSERTITGDAQQISDCDAYIYLASGDTNQVILGVGANVSKNGVNTLAIQVHDLATDKVSWNVWEANSSGSGGTISIGTSVDLGSFENYITLEKGYAMTGFEFTINDNNSVKFKNIKAWYQQIDYSQSQQAFLDNSLYYACTTWSNPGVQGNGNCKKDSDYNSGDGEYVPSNYNQKIMTGLGISHKKGTITEYVLQFDELECDVDPGSIQ